MNEYDSKIEVSVGDKRMANISFYLLLGLIALLPVWVLPFTGYAVGFSKSLLIGVCVVLAAVFYLVHLLQSGSLPFAKNFVYLGLAAILLVNFISSLLSKSFAISFFGAGSETDTFVSLLLLSIGFLLITFLFQSEKKVLLALALLGCSSVVIFVYSFLHSVFNLNISLWNLFQRMEGPLGSWNEFSIFFGFIALASLVFFEFFKPQSARLKVFFFGLLGISLLAMLLVNFTVVWVAFGSILLVFLVYIYSVQRASKNFARLSLFVVLLVVFFILARVLIGDVITSLGLDYAEIRPSWSATFAVAKDTVTESAKNFIVGSGPNTFVYDWFQFKPTDINRTLFWNARFNAGIGLLPTFVATTGVFGILAWLFFFLAILYYGAKLINYSGSELTKGLLMTTFLGSVYLWVFNIIYAPGIFIFALAFIVSALFLSLLIKSELIILKNYQFAENATFSFVSGLMIMLLLIGGVAGFYSIFQKYWAAYSFSRGFSVFNRDGNLDEAENYFSKALMFDNQDRFYGSLAEVGLMKLSRVLSQPLSQEEMRAQFQSILAKTIQDAQSAANVNPFDSGNWLRLGQVYEALLPFQVDGAKEFAIDAYKKALEREPSNPVFLLSSARVEIQAKDYKSARTFLEGALERKSDYTPALFLLAQLEAEEGNLAEAVKRTEQALLSSPNDVGVLFQLGMLYYQKKDYANARLVLERTVSVSPNYSNAMYFLGLVYDNLDMTKEAIGQFKRIEELNPDNEEIKKILKNLEAGKGALQEISPPAPAPESREEPPF